MAPRTIDGRYVVERAVGHGGMGSVWLCHDEVLGRYVAVKQVGSMPGESTSDLARALREARSSAALNHPNVVSVYDAVEDGDHNWLVMEYVPSRTLSELVAQDGPLTPERAAWIGAQAADGLSAAHERGTVHRDVKPGNILVTEDDRVKITDFGIARTHGDAQLTRSSIVVGTPAYFAPELAKGADPTEAADVWALGACLYAAVEGRLPYPDQKNAIALLAQIASSPPPTPERAGFLAEPIARMMDPDPRTRWTMGDVAHTLHRLHAQHGSASGPGTVSFTAPAPAPVGAPADDLPATEDGEHDPDAGETAAPATPHTDRAARASAPASSAVAADDGSGRRSRWPMVAAALLLVAIVSVGAFVLATRDAGDDQVAAPDSTATTDEPEDGGTGDDAPEAEQPADPPDDAATDPGQFVEGYYDLLPGDPETAWDLLAPPLQDDVGGYGAYAGFWDTISAVRVDATRPAGDGALDVDLTYTSARGTESETRRLVLEEGDDGYLIVGDRPQ